MNCGRVVIPVDFRYALGWKEKDEICVVLNEENREIILKENKN